MKKTITIEAPFCDHCNLHTYVAPCLRCKTEHCWHCQEKLGVTYCFSTYGSGTGDGYYCRPCDILLCESKNDAIHNAYTEIRLLRQENVDFLADWRLRAEKVEAELKKLQGRQ